MQCNSCSLWAHDSCAGYDPRVGGSFVCCVSSPFGSPNGQARWSVLSEMTQCEHQCWNLGQVGCYVLS